MLTGLPDYFPENMLMAKVYTIEVTDRDNGPAKIIGYVIKMIENLHARSMFPLPILLMNGNITRLTLISSAFLIFA